MLHIGQAKYLTKIGTLRRRGLWCFEDCSMPIPTSIHINKMHGKSFHRGTASDTMPYLLRTYISVVYRGVTKQRGGRAARLPTYSCNIYMYTISLHRGAVFMIRRTSGNSRLAGQMDKQVNFSDSNSLV